ncbi:MAG: hypothetical protein OXC00_12210 [Acidimicrobiaceae bacterium]|nr:hypothetical protein [Acidimicrobiaceae bacterium]
MAIAIETRDCTALGDSDLAEMADLCAISSNSYEVGSLSKQAEAWVLVTEARDNGKLRGFSFCPLERIGGTPCVLIGAGHTCRTTRRDTVLRGIVADQLRRAALSFPDEDVLVGMQINDPGAFEAFKNLHDVVPRPGHKATGEERAWGRRLAKRFGIGALSYEDRVFTTRGKGGPPVVLDHASLKPERIPAEVTDLLDSLVLHDGDTLIVHGWVMAEELEKLL